MSGVVVIFRNRKGKAFAKRFRTGNTARKAVRGLASIGAKRVDGLHRAKGFKFGRIVKRMNRRK